LRTRRLRTRLRKQGRSFQTSYMPCCTRREYKHSGRERGWHVKPLILLAGSRIAGTLAGERSRHCRRPTPSEHVADRKDRQLSAHK
jgi:hypothetical protein